MTSNKILQLAIILLTLFFAFTVQNASAQSNDSFDKIINDSYLEAFGRYPSEGERKSWIEPVRRKVGYDEIIASHLSFMISDEGENELRQTIARSYQSAFGRDPNREELVSGIDGIKRKGGLTFTNIVDEHVDFMQTNRLNQGFEEMRQTIIRSYQAVFRRQPNTQELNSWIQYMKNNRTQYWQLLIKHARFLGADKDY